MAPEQYINHHKIDEKVLAKLRVLTASEQTQQGFSKPAQSGRPLQQIVPLATMAATQLISSRPPCSGHNA